MERKRVRYKSPSLGCNNKDELISKNNYVLLTKESEIEDSDHEVHTSEKKDLQQSCIFDPSFTIDSSSSDSAESSSSNEWVNCEDDIEEEDEDNQQSPVSVSVVQNRKFVLADFIPVRNNACSDKLPENESTRCYQLSKELPEHETNKSLKISGDNNLHIKKTLKNKVQLSKKRIEPCFDEKLLTKNPQTLLSSISKLYIGGYNKLTSLAGYISESESSVYSEDSTKKAIKSILKRERKNQIGDNPKKKVRFDLNLRSFHNVTSNISQLPIENYAKASDENVNYEIKIESRSIELGRPHSNSENNSKEQIVENNIEIYREQCNIQNCFTNKESFSNTKQDDKMTKNLFTVPRECKKISFDSLGTEKLLEECPTLQESLRTKRIRNEVKDTHCKPNSNNLLSDTIDLIPSTSRVAQSDQVETDSENGCSKIINMGTESLTESVLENQSLITEGEYSSFIKDLVNGSGDKLAKFLINLSSEISSKSGEDTIANALKNVGFVQKKKGSYDSSNKIQRKAMNRNVKLVEDEMDSNKCDKDNGSLKKISRNELNSSKKNKRNMFTNNRRSMSEFDIHSLKSKEPYCNSYREKRFHNSKADQLFIKDTKDDCKLQSSSKKHPNTNDEVMGRLYEIMAELKQNVDKICRKESTIRIENAQIWLKENKQVEKSISTEGSTKETYSQTTETIGVHVEDDIEKQAVSKTEILIVSNSKNDDINIKLNDKSTKNRYVIESTKKNEREYELNEIEERKRFFEENRQIPFNVVFNDKTHLPTLKKGKYEVEIFEKIDGQIIHDTNLKNFMRKLTSNLNSIKLNGLQSYDKHRNIEHSSSKSNYSRSSKQDKSVPNLLTTLLNKILKLRMNLPVKKTNCQFLNSQLWDDRDQVSTLKSFNPDNNESKHFSASKDTLTGSNNVENISSKCIGSKRERTNMFEDISWPDVIKTRYPNGMIYFGPLTLMPEPNFEVNERRSTELLNCSCPEYTGSHQYVFNKHMKHTVKASMSRNLSHQPEGGVSLEAFSETEEEFYHQWNEMGKV